MKASLLWAIAILSIIFYGCEEDHVDFPQQSFDEMRSAFIEDGRVALLEADYRLDSLTNQLEVRVLTTVDTALQAIQDWANQEKGIRLQEIQLLPDDHLAASWALVRLSAANIRSEGRHSAELVTQAIMGTPVRVLQEKNDWYRIQTPDHYIGWVDPSALSFMTSTELEEWRQSERVMYMEFSGRAWAAPQPNVQAVCDLVMGAILIPTGQQKRGYKEVQLPDGRLAWIGAEEAESLEEVIGRTEEVQAAELEWSGKEMMGAPYLWGGTSSKGVDCSGFTKTLYWMNGWLLPRDASQQVHVGKEVPVTDSLEQLEEGDLLYFGRYREDGSPKVTHVALHIGDRMILHSSGEVKIESLNPTDSLFNAYRYNSILSARRILGQGTQFGIQTIAAHPWYFTQDLLQ
jgi:SH3-like domain-containing protein